MPKKNKEKEPLTEEQIKRKDYAKEVRRTSLRFGLILFVYNIIATAVVIGIAALVVFGFNLEFSPVAGFIFLIVALVIDMIISFTLTSIAMYRSNLDIERIKQALNQMMEGDYNINLKLRTRSRPFKEIAEMINDLAKELDSVSILKRDFTKNFSHEFKTPIASIKGYTELLLEDKHLSDEERNKYYSIIVEQTEFLANLANSTLLLSNLESSNIVIDKVDLYIDEEIEEIALLSYSDVEAKNIEVDIELDHWIVNASKDLFQDLWMNLINNAIKYTKVDGHIKIRSEEDDSEIRISILDDGVGISEESLPHIFETYYQERQPGSNKGIGLGLSICKQICDAFGWDIEAKSKKGMGSTFTVHIPKMSANEY
ncbi:MAG: HAMP domain-containing histidine kinase [Coprobacillus sp.]|nr:HAMP domain-containing histidine kinase [Coprobacillus sp.]